MVFKFFFPAKQMMEMVASGSEVVDSVEGGQESDEDIGPPLPPGFSKEVSHSISIPTWRQQCWLTLNNLAAVIYYFCNFVLLISVLS